MIARPDFGLGTIVTPTRAAAKIYLAGPEVFLRNPREIGDAKVAICARYGLDGRFPLDDGLHFDGAPTRDHGYAIYRGNEKLMGECDAIIANLTPFRGPGMDVGTAFEIGYMRAKGKKLFGYTNSPLCLFDRVLKADPKGFKRRKEPAPGIIFEDSEKLGVEQFGFADNLMIDSAIHESGSAVISGRTKRRERYTDLTVFEDCVRRAAAQLAA
jgi:nucleoside 2-deoxyribosyltransferase